MLVVLDTENKEVLSAFDEKVKKDRFNYLMKNKGNDSICLWYTNLLTSEGHMKPKGITFCIKLKFLQSFDRKGAQSPIKFFSLESQEIISFSALSESASRIASSDGATPSSALILLSCNEYSKKENL